MKCSIMLHFIRDDTVCKVKKDLQQKNTIYSRTSMAGTRQDPQCEFDPSMNRSDTWSDNFQGSSQVLKCLPWTPPFYDQSC